MATKSKVYVGTQIRLRAEWRKPADPNEEPAATNPLADPSLVTLEVRQPDGTSIDATSAIVRDSQGKYHALFTPTMQGEHEAVWRGTGNAEQVAITWFYANIA